MKGTLFTIIIGLFLNQFTTAQTTPNLQPFISVPQKAQTAEQSAAIEEANRLNDLVTKLYSESNYDEGLSLAKRQLEAAEKAGETSPLLVVGALGNIAELYIAKKQYNEALQPSERNLTLLEREFGLDHPRLGVSLDRLAFLSYMKGDFKQTESLYLRTLSIKEKAFGKDSIEVAGLLRKLNVFYQARKDVENGRKIFSRMMEIIEKAPDSALSGMEEDLNRYACLKRMNSQTVGSSQPALLPIADLYDTLNLPKGAIRGKPISLPQPVSLGTKRTDGTRRADTGPVIVRIVIDESGKVVQACAVSGPGGFAQVTEEAARRARFMPTLVEGKPAKVKGIITYNLM